MLVGLVLILSLIVTLLVFCRKNVLLQCRTRVHDRKNHSPVERKEPVMQSEETPTEEGEHQGEVNVTTPDGSGTSLQFLYHERSIKKKKLCKIIHM
jgi:hypothetical protein